MGIDHILIRYEQIEKKNSPKFYGLYFRESNNSSDRQCTSPKERKNKGGGESKRKGKALREKKEEKTKKRAERESRRGWSGDAGLCEPAPAVHSSAPTGASPSGRRGHSPTPLVLPEIVLAYGIIIIKN